MAKRAKIFNNGGSQAVRLPAEFRFSGGEVYVWRDERTGDIVLSSGEPRRWSDFMGIRDAVSGVPADFLADREQPNETRDPFDPA